MLFSVDSNSLLSSSIITLLTSTCCRSCGGKRPHCRPSSNPGELLYRINFNKHPLNYLVVRVFLFSTINRKPLLLNGRYVLVICTSSARMASDGVLCSRAFTSTNCQVFGFQRAMLNNNSMLLFNAEAAVCCAL